MNGPTGDPPIDESEEDDLSAQAVEERQARIPLEAAGRRFDVVLAELFAEFSRSRLAEWIRCGDARLDGRAVKPREPVRGGEAVSLLARATAQTAAHPEAIPVTVLYQDPDLLVLDKPAGLVVHPGAGNPTGTLVNALLHRDPRLAELPRAGIVHRLDKDTSGAMVVARSLRAHAGLVAQIAGREVQREYLAVVAGPMVAGGTVDAPIGRHPRERLKMAVVAGGRPAITHYRVRERFRAHTLVECRLETGRTHQIRVHMVHIRHPIVGDPLYSRLTLPKGAGPALVAALRGFGRQALHAARLRFTHPVSGQALDFQAPLPADMQGLLAALRGDAELDPSVAQRGRRS